MAQKANLSTKKSQNLRKLTILLADKTAIEQKFYVELIIPM